MRSLDWLAALAVVLIVLLTVPAIIAFVTDTIDSEAALLTTGLLVAALLFSILVGRRMTRRPERVYW